MYLWSFRGEGAFHERPSPTRSSTTWCGHAACRMTVETIWKIRAASPPRSPAPHPD